MFFGLKKFVSFWMMPLPFCLTALLVGLWLMTRPKRARLGRIVAISALGLLMILGNHFVSRALIRPLETRYPAIPELKAGDPLPPTLAACKYVVVLGGGNGFSPGLSALNELSAGSRGRIAEGVRLLRLLPEAKLIVSGPSDGRRQAHAVVLARAAISLGVDERRIVLIDQALDTEDEARAVQRQVSDAQVALVTSAWHMPRAAALFNHAYVRHLPCPADFISHDEDSFAFHHLLFDVNALQCSTAAIRERIGYLWALLRGRA